jgi:hypothetical protein
MEIWKGGRRQKEELAPSDGQGMSLEIGHPEVVQQGEPVCPYILFWTEVTFLGSKFLQDDTCPM